MDTQTAEKITSLTVKAFMTRQGLCAFSDADAIALGEYDLDEWIHANRICKERNGNGYQGMVIATRGLAELYTRQ